MSTLAIFDLDHTLIAMDCELEWSRFLKDAGVLSDDNFKKMQQFLHQYDQGELDFEHYIAASVAMWNTIESDRLIQLRQYYVDQKVLPNVYVQAAEILESHDQAGDERLLISASNAFLVAPIARALGFKHYIGTDLKQINDQFLGEIDGVASFSDGKVKRLKQWLNDENKTFNQHIFYSDSINDAPLLMKADIAIVINPDPKLAQLAKQQGWQERLWLATRYENMPIDRVG